MLSKQYILPLSAPPHSCTHHSCPPLILAHDLGTTGNKATLFDVDGSVVASTFAAYETRYAQPNWAEQDPADWRTALFDSTRQLLEMAQIAGRLQQFGCGRGQL